jgi:hypothetical protein
MSDVLLLPIESSIPSDLFAKRIDTSRTDDSRLDSISFPIGNIYESVYHAPHKDIHSQPGINIYRYKFTDEFTGELFKFSKIHQYDHRKDFKEAWLTWLEENEYLVESEVRRLTSLGYVGDITDKMFKSARYYFRKKSTEKKAPAQRRDYIAVRKELLEAIDVHIKNIIVTDSKPSDGFDDFCKNNKEVLNEEIRELSKNGMRDSDEIKSKIKKTYKNRHFLIVSK